MKRRHFLTSLGAGSATSILVRAESPPSVRSLETDVLVIGGGTAGTIAAIQAGRLGARTILVESGSQLGGTTTTAGVDFPGLFHAWGKQVIAGIGWELVKSAVDMGSGELPDFTKPTGRQHWRHQVRICGALYAALAEEAAVKAGVQLRYYESPLSVTPLPGLEKIEAAFLREFDRKMYLVWNSRQLLIRPILKRAKSVLLAFVG